MNIKKYLFHKISILLIIVAIIGGLAYREILIREYPLSIRHHQNIIQKICTEEYRENFLDVYPELEGNNMDVDTLLSWLHIKMKYPETDAEHGILNDFRINSIDHEDPITIIDFGLGRCGEFSIAFTAVLYAQGYTPRMVVDSSLDSPLNGNITDGDHVWVEYWYNGWIHIDPTESRINDPLMYERDWGKIVTNVWGIEKGSCERIEERYQYEI